MPSLLLADRARRRNNATAMVAFLEEAATRPRFDDYESRGALILWEAVRALPGTVDPAARAELAAALRRGARHRRGRARCSRCAAMRASVADNIRAACAAAGNGGGAAGVDVVAAHRGRTPRRASADAGRA